MVKSTMQRGSTSPGTMSPSGIGGIAGHFGLKKNRGLPSGLTAKEEKEIAPDVQESETIPTMPEKETSTAKPTMNVPEEKVEDVSKMEEVFECPVCGKTFSKKIALVGHMRSHKKK